MQIETTSPTVSPYPRALFQVFLYVAESGSSAGVRELQGFLTTVGRRQNFRSARVAVAAEEVVGLFQLMWREYRAGNIGCSDRDILAAVAELRKGLSAVEAALICPDLLTIARKTAKSAAAQENLSRIRTLFFPDTLKERPAQVVSIFGGRRVGGSSPAIAAPESESRAPEIWDSGKLAVRCTAVYEESHDVKTFVFAPTKSGTLCRFNAGQFVTLELSIDAKIIKRSYTISSPPSRPYNFSITVKRNPGGLVSNWLHSNMLAGVEIGVSGPHGKFNIEDIPSTKQLFISGGSGITPVLSMTRWLFDIGRLSDAVFIHCARTPKDLLFYDELTDIAKKNPGLKIAYLCSENLGLSGWTGFRGRISSQMIEMTAADFRERIVYTCGPAPFMSAVKEMLETAGLPAGQYHQESFGNPSPSAKKGPEEAISASSARPAIETLTTAAVISVRPAPIEEKGTELNFRGSRKAIFANDGETVLEAAERCGVQIPNSCRAGACGCCKMRKLSGEVEMADGGGLTEEEKSAGYILPCVCVGKTKLEIDF